MEKLHDEWIKRLGLTDWTITFQDHCESWEMSADECVGCTDYEESTKCARIQILDEKFYGKRIIPYDYEKTLVHELLHLKTSLLSLSSDELQERVAHQIIDDLAKALVDAKRAGKESENE